MEDGMTTTKEDIGLAIKMLRKKAGIKTQGDLGKKINPKPLSKETINRIENGRGNYGINALFRIAKVLNCDFADFIEPKKPSRTAMFEEFLEDYTKKIMAEEQAKYEKIKKLGQKIIKKFHPE